MPRLILEVPVDRRTEYAAWPAETSRLLAFDDDARTDEERRRAFARWIHAVLGPNASCIWAHPLEYWIGDSQMRDFAAGMASGGNPIQVSQTEWLFICRCCADIEYLMHTSAFSQVLYFIAPSRAAAERVVLRAGDPAAAVDDRFDTPFVIQQPDIGLLAFYSFTHDNIEFVGDRDLMIGGCFDVLLRMSN